MRAQREFLSDADAAHDLPGDLRTECSAPTPTEPRKIQRLCRVLLVARDHALVATLSSEKFNMNPLLSSLNVQTWATCWAHACNWLVLRAGVPIVGLHRCHRWCAHWRRCPHHPSISTQALKCDVEDDHPIIECLGAPSQSQVWSVTSRTCLTGGMGPPSRVLHFVIDCTHLQAQPAIREYGDLPRPRTNLESRAEEGRTVSI